MDGPLETIHKRARETGGDPIIGDLLKTKNNCGLFLDESRESLWIFFSE